MATVSKSKSGAGLSAIAADVVVMAVAAALIIQAQRPPKSVRPILWDREVCRQCGMTISDPRFACQLQTSDGDVYDFDDPGCLLTFIHRHRPHVHAIYFHALVGSAWLRYPNVAFVRGQQTPMGYGLGAQASGTPGALDFTSAQNYIATRSAELRERAKSSKEGAEQ